MLKHPLSSRYKLAGHFFQKPSRFVSSLLLLSIAGVLARPDVVSAQQTTYNWTATSGNWSVGANWYNPTAGTSGTAPLFNVANQTVNLTNGTEGTPAATTLNTSWFSAASNVVTIGAHNTVTMADNVGMNNKFGTFTNQGIIQTSGSSHLMSPITNSGTIQALSGGKLVLWDATITNTGGTIQALSGGMVLAHASVSVVNGSLKILTSGTFYQDANANPNQTFTLTGVTLTNEGQFINICSVYPISSEIAAGTIATTLGAGTSFDNRVGATTRVANEGAVTTTNNSARNSVFNVQSGATFDNKGTLLVQNDAARDGAVTAQVANFNVAAGGTLLNTGTISVIDNSVATGATAALSSTNSFINQGTVRITGDANNSGASFSVMGVSNTYTQSGAGKLTVLNRGGTLSASSISITSGTLGGIGSVIGNTTIGSSATLAVSKPLGEPLSGGVLNFGNNLTLSGTTDIVLGTAGANRVSPGTSDRVAVAGVLNLGGALNLSSDGNAGPGSYRIATHGSVTGSFSSVNAIGSGANTLHSVVDTSTPGSVYLDVYSLAAANTVATTVDLGIVHKNGTFGTFNLSISNTGTGGAYTETLNASVKGTSGSASASGSVSNLSTSGGTSTAISVGLGGSNYTGSVGIVSGNVTVGFRSNGVGTFGDTDLADQTVTVTGQVNDYAAPVLSSTGDLTEVSSTSFKLNLGSVAEGSGVISIDLALSNELQGIDADFQDLLSGELSGFNLFTLQSGTANFSNMIAGTDTGWVIAIDTSGKGPGVYSDMLTLALSSDNLSGSYGLPSLALEVELTVVPEPGMAGLLLGGAGVFVGIHRIRRRSV